MTQTKIVTPTKSVPVICTYFMLKRITKKYVEGFCAFNTDSPVYIFRFYQNTKCVDFRARVGEPSKFGSDAKLRKALLKSFNGKDFAILIRKNPAIVRKVQDTQLALFKENA